MTREECRALRESLVDQDFFRTGFTNDLDGTGRYQERWVKDDTVVTIHWGARVR